ncbi:MAG: hypothetical protein JNN07_05280 [Verrucomicrobiales bacterium]|nr:hypothetical protein [Verrucomicrobiales bacterium]
MKPFKQVAGMSLVAYLNHSRLADAASLLGETTRSIAETANRESRQIGRPLLRVQPTQTA